LNGQWRGGGASLEHFLPLPMTSLRTDQHIGSIGALIRPVIALTAVRWLVTTLERSAQFRSSTARSIAPFLILRQVLIYMLSANRQGARDYWNADLRRRPLVIINRAQSEQTCMRKNVFVWTKLQRRIP
jgi:hypothetical protein